MARRKKNYTTNPITGKQERVLRSDETQNPWTGKVSRRRTGKRRLPTKKSARSSKQEIDPAFILFVLVAVALAIVYQWAVNNPILFWSIITLIVVGTGVALWKIPSIRPRFLNNVLGSATSHPKSDEASDLEDPYGSIVQAIRETELEPVRNEEDFEKQLYQWLKAKGFKVQRQVNDRTRSPVDIVVDGQVAIELKIAESLNSVRTLVGQVADDVDEYDNVIGVILDAGKLSGVEEYAEKIKRVNPEKVDSVILKAPLNRRKRKDKYFQVRQSTTYK
ncbi:MAG: hypothetical protein ACMXYM_01080 [Candidatus Woesearchaeota archaeon]